MRLTATFTDHAVQDITPATEVLSNSEKPLLRAIWALGTKNIERIKTGQPPLELAQISTLAVDGNSVSPDEIIQYVTAHKRDGKRGAYVPLGILGDLRLSKYGHVDGSLTLFQTLPGILEPAPVA